MMADDGATPPLAGTFVTAENLVGGEDPWCVLEWLSRPGLTEARQLLMVRAIMPPGEAHLFHYHPMQEEIIYVVSGEAEQWLGETSMRLGPGDVAHIPPGLVHATFNRGGDPLVFLATLSPAEVDGDVMVDVSGEDPWRGLGGR